MDESGYFRLPLSMKLDPKLQATLEKAAKTGVPAGCGRGVSVMATTMPSYMICRAVGLTHQWVLENQTVAGVAVHLGAFIKQSGLNPRKAATLRIIMDKVGVSHADYRRLAEKGVSYRSSD